MTARALSALLLLLVSLVAAGCVQVAETLTLAADGSGRLALRYGLHDQWAGEALRERFRLDPEEIRRQFAPLAPRGLRLEEVSGHVAGEWHYVDLGLAFDQLPLLWLWPPMADRGFALRRTPDGAYELQFTYGPPPRGPPLTAEEQGSMAALLKGFEIATTLRLPGRVLASNADRTGEREVTWRYRMDEHPADLERMQRDEPHWVVFSGDGLEMKEFGWLMPKGM